MMAKEILKMSYYDLVNFHYPKNLDLPKVPSFYITALESVNLDAFTTKPLPIQDDLNWEDIRRFIFFRFWIAYKRFPGLEYEIQKGSRL